MFNYYFEDDITVENVNTLVEVIQDKEDVTLWFATDGGIMASMRYLISVLNSLPNLTVIIHDYLISAGILLLTDYTGKLVIIDTVDFFVIHTVDRESYQIRKQSICAKKLLKQTKEDGNIFAEKLKNKGILNNKQYKQFLLGQDIILYRDEILKLNLSNVKNTP
jgi:hypothetical protein